MAQVLRVLIFGVKYHGSLERDVSHGSEIFVMGILIRRLMQNYFVERGGRVG